MMKDVFISYGRAESKGFATQLHERLTALGYDTWFDQNDIPLAVDFQSQIDEGITRAQNFIFIIAPHAIKSEYCLKEIILAIRYKKRIIPILHIEPSSKEIWDKLHPTIAKLNWIYAREKENKEIPQEQWESIDDFEKALTGIHAIMQSHKVYIRQHNELLLKGLEWRRNRNSVQYLLTGEERVAAEKWLLQDFKNEQAPCVPSEMHSDFICESKKNGENMMTEVFIAYAAEDSAYREAVKRALALRCITTWVHNKDIQSGQDYEEAIRVGLEQASNFLFFISQQSVVSEYCLKELHYVIQLNKPIIPLLIEPVAVEKFPPEIRHLQYIDFTDNKFDLDTLQDINALLSELANERQYRHEHKMLLVKALKWERQNHNPSILLRGFNLEEGKSWLDVAKKRKNYQPLPLHEQFINESIVKSGTLGSEVFISYSRADGDFARKLNDALQVYGKTTWFDQESIAAGTNFQQEIYRGIETSDNFLFIISPNSLDSPYCVDETDYAQKYNKRMITVLCRTPTNANFPPALASVQWLDFRDHFDESFTELIRTLDTDRAHVQSHTKYSQEAKDWEEKNRNPDFLLNGSEFIIAKAWLEDADKHHKKPLPTPLQRELIAESDKAINAAVRKQRRLFIFMRASLVAAVITLAVALLAFWSAVDERQKATERREEAEKSAAEAVKSKIQAEKSAAEAEKSKIEADEERNRAVSEQMKAKYAQQNAEQSRKEALEQKKIAEESEQQAKTNEKRAIEKEQEARLMQVQAQLSKAESEISKEKAEQLSYVSKAKEIALKAVSLDPSPENKELKAFLALLSYNFHKTHKGDIYDPDVFDALHQANKLYAPDSTHYFKKANNKEMRALVLHDNALLGGSADGGFWQWKLSNPAEVPKKVGETKFLIRNIAFFPKQNLIVGSGESKQIVLKNISKPDEANIILNGHKSNIRFLTAVPSKSMLISTDIKGTMIFWDIDRRTILREYTHPKNLKSFALNPDQNTLVFSDEDKKIWYLDLNKLQENPINTKSTDEIITAMTFSPDGKKLALGFQTGELQIFNPADQSTEKFSKGHVSTVYSIAYKQDGKLIATAGYDGKIMLWNAAQLKNLPIVVKDHENWVRALAFDAKTGKIISSGTDRLTINNLTSIDELAQELLKNVKPSINRDLWNQYVGADVPYKEKITSLK